MSSNESSLKLPPHWGDDSLSGFISAAFSNTLATFVRKPAFGVLAAIDASFQKIGENLDNPPDILAAFLAHRSHSAFRGACRLAASGQVSETFPLLRSCIEYALYALHINSNAGLGEIWLRRHDDENALKLCKSSFRHHVVIATLNQRDPNLYKIIDTLYERTIEFGAHPNERAITGSMTLEEAPQRTNFQSIYLHSDAVALDHGLKVAGQIGLGSLLTFEHIFRDRFRSLGIDVELQKLRRGL